MSELDRAPSASFASLGRAARLLAFAILCIACVAFATIYVWRAARRASERAEVAHSVANADPKTLDATLQQPRLMFLQTDGDEYRRIAIVALDALPIEGGAPLDPSSKARKLTSLQCQRFYFTNGRGLALGHTYDNGSRSVFGAFTFDERFEPLHTFAADGLPSRARLSRDGKLGAFTEFVGGDSYANAGFSTRTNFIDIEHGEQLASLEQFKYTRDGRAFQALDFNFWGVTFELDGRHFFATLATHGKTHLIHGDVDSRTALVLRENVECPSIAPDGRRIAFKKRVGQNGAITWRLCTLDIATMQERELAEPRSIDDQVEWLDDRRILYVLRDEGPPPTIRPDIWMVAVDDGTAPRMLMQGAMSPVVNR